MSEYFESKPVVPNKIKRKATAIALAGVAAIGATTYVTRGAFEVKTPSEQPTYPIPDQKQPHDVYIVKPGDTEGGIAAIAGHPNDMEFMNMINNQLPKEYQADRMLHPGDRIILPEDSLGHEG